MAVLAHAEAKETYGPSRLDRRSADRLYIVIEADDSGESTIDGLRGAPGRVSLRARSTPKLHAARAAGASITL